jgi:hypothetical protein
LIIWDDDGDGGGIREKARFLIFILHFHLIIVVRDTNRQIQHQILYLPGFSVLAEEGGRPGRENLCCRNKL